MKKRALPLAFICAALLMAPKGASARPGHIADRVNNFVSRNFLGGLGHVYIPQKRNSARVVVKTKAPGTFAFPSAKITSTRSTQFKHVLRDFKVYVGPGDINFHHQASLLRQPGKRMLLLSKEVKLGAKSAKKAEVASAAITDVKVESDPHWGWSTVSRLGLKTNHKQGGEKLQSIDVRGLSAITVLPLTDRTQLFSRLPKQYRPELIRKIAPERAQLLIKKRAAHALLMKDKRGHSKFIFGQVISSETDGQVVNKLRVRPFTKTGRKGRNTITVDLKQWQLQGITLAPVPVKDIPSLHKAVQSYNRDLGQAVNSLRSFFQGAPAE